VPHTETIQGLYKSELTDMSSPMQQLVQLAKALADPTRIRVLTALRSGELCVCELCDALGIAQSTLSTHLQFIRQAGLVQTRKQGKWVYYSLQPGQETLLTSVFESFAVSLGGDPTLQRDARMLADRLKDRQAGACCVGFCRPKRPSKP